MGKIDYSLLGSLSLKDTGFLSESNEELMSFIAENQMFRVSKFLEMMDDGSFVKSTYADTMNMARGLADILKNKHFGTPIISDVYLLNPIYEMDFEVPFGDIKILGIRKNLKIKKTIYEVLHRLGFIDKEVHYVVSKYWDNPESNTLFSIFRDMLLDKKYENTNVNSEEMIFYNKIKYYVDYINFKVNNATRLELQRQIDDLLNEMETLIEIRNDVDKHINEIKNSI